MPLSAGAAFSHFTKAMTKPEFWFTVDGSQASAVDAHPLCTDNTTGHRWSARMYGEEVGTDYRYSTCHDCHWHYAFKTHRKGTQRVS